MDMTKLENQTINFQGLTQISLDDNCMPNVECLAAEYSSNDKHGFHMVLPRKSDNKLYNVPRAFKGHMEIIEYTDLPNFKISARCAPHERTEENNSDIDSGVHEDDNEQWGGCDITKKKRKKLKTNIAEELTNGSNNISTDISTNIESHAVKVEGNESPKRKHKKSKKRSQELNTPILKMELSDLDAESIENFQVPVNEEEYTRKRKKDKHKRKEKKLDQIPDPMDFAKIDIKAELECTDVSEDIGLWKKLREESSIIQERKRGKKRKRELKDQEQVLMSVDVELENEADLISSLSETSSINRKAKKKKKKHENE